MINNRKLASVEFLRFFAALSVAFVHLPATTFGGYGVDLFFVISGFVLMYSSERPSDLFFIRRFFRIAPLYYLFTFLVIIVYSLDPKLLNNTVISIEYIYKSFLFIPYDKNGLGHYPILFVGWSLNYEIFFYAIFSLSIYISRSYRSLVVSFLIFLIFYLSSLFDGFIFGVYSNLVILDFIFGVMVFELYFKKNFRFVFVIFIVCLCIFLVAPSPNDFSFYVYGAPSAIFLYFILYFERNFPLRKLILVLGGSSYAMYLLHIFIIQAFDLLVVRVFPYFVFDFYSSALALLLIIISSVFVYLIIDKPLQSYFSRFIFNFKSR